MAQGKTTMNDWMRNNGEPCLDEVLRDTIVTALIRCDGVTERHVREVVQRARRQPAPARHGPGSLPAYVSTSSF